MKTKDRKVAASTVTARDDLLRLEIRIAQRADQLWNQDGRDRCNGLKHWLQAEREIFARRPWALAQPL